LRFSLNQIDQTSRKAARGAGLPWGLADEVGKAVRWLHIHRLNGAPALAAWLDRHHRRRIDYAQRAPASLSGVWRAPGGQLDPLVVGASLSDCIEGRRGTGIETGAIAHPLLAAGFIGVMAQSRDLAFTLTWPGGRLSCRRGGVQVSGSAVDAETAAFLRCRPSEPRGRDFRGRCRAPRIGEAVVDSGAWARLEDHARRTCVSATVASRLAGAGAGLRDND